MAFIYKILNNKNGKFYIGGTNNFDKRKYQHVYHLKKGTHGNYKLQNDWNAQAEEDFEFLILEEVSDTDQFEREQTYLDGLKFIEEKRYNIISNSMGSPEYYNPKTKKCIICKEKFETTYLMSRFCPNCEMFFEGFIYNGDTYSEDDDDYNHEYDSYKHLHIDDWDDEDHLTDYYQGRLEK